MSIALSVYAVTEQQADALLNGKILTGDLVTPSGAAYRGEGDITHIGCGCVMSVAALFTIVIPTGFHLGWKTAGYVALILQMLIVLAAWRAKRNLYPPIDVDKIDPRRLVPDDAIVCVYSWPTLHYLLTGTEADGELPAAFLLHGGQDLPEHEDDGEYGPPRLVPNQELEAISQCLESVQITDGCTSSRSTMADARAVDRDDLASELSSLSNLVNSSMREGRHLMLQMG